MIEKDAFITQNLTEKYKVTVDGRTFFCVNTVRPDYRSEMGNQLAALSKDNGMEATGGIIYEVDDKTAIGYGTHFKISLRSIGDVDTTSMSEKYGGGGHKNASSFMLPIGEWNALIIN